MVTHRGKLIAVIELKSQVGPSFGNNFNNRAEEAIGTGHDFQMAYKEKNFENHPKPFIGWFILVEDAEGSRRAIRDKCSHFPLSEAFKGASYLKRYDILCQRLMKGQIYTAASLLASPRTAISTGEYKEMSKRTGLSSFVTLLARHVAGEALRSKH